MAEKEKERQTLKIRVNGVAPGPIRAPLIPAPFPKEKVKVLRRRRSARSPRPAGRISPLFRVLGF